MNVYGHIFESMGEKMADTMEEIHRAALEA